MTRQSRLMGRVLGASALLGLSFALSAAIAPAEANKVGVAAAVNPDAFSSLAGAPKSQLNIGKSIFFNERIATTTSGLVQVLLVDGSTFTVGPDSDLVIDKFVYDPNKGTGPDRGLLLQGRDALRRRQDLEERQRRHHQHAGRSHGRPRLHHPHPGQARDPGHAVQFRRRPGLRRLPQDEANLVIYEHGNGIFISANGNAAGQAGDSGRSSTA